MAFNFICTTPLAGLRFISYRETALFDCHPQICALVRALGPDYELLFAKPVFNADGNSIDWYTSVAGPVHHADELPQPGRGAVMERFDRMMAELEALQGRITSPTRAELLRSALSYPDQTHVYCIGSKPVLTCWGFEPGHMGLAQGQHIDRLGQAAAVAPGAAGAAAAPGALQSSPPAAAVPPAAAAAAPVAVPWWRRHGLCLLLALLLLLLLWLLTTRLTGCTPALPWPTGCAPAVQAPPPAAAPAPKPALDPAPKAAPKPAPKAAPKASPKPGPAKKDLTDRNLKETDEALSLGGGTDISVLEGMWRCPTGLANARTDEPIVVDFEFDRSGRGRGVVRESDGSLYIATATAKFVGQTIEIETSPYRRNRTAAGKEYDYVASSIVCRQVGAQALCTGRSGDTRWDDAVFKRIR